MRARLLCLILLFGILSTTVVLARPQPPRLHVNTDGITVQLHWTPVADAQGYLLLYAPYPYQGPETIGSIDLGNQTEFSAQLWQGAAYYAAIQAYDAQGEKSEFSNIGFVLIKDRGDAYRQYWRRYIQDQEDETYRNDAFLYQDTPDPDNCRPGALTPEAIDRAVTAMNQIRALHSLPQVIHAQDYDTETQETPLIQRANQFINHFPPESARCYSQTAADGSRTRNLSGGGSGNEDPAAHLVGWSDDANNISTVAAVGHRRWILDPFTTQTSYGQVFGYAALKVFGFTDEAPPDPTTVPDFVAFPYQRYPYVLLSSPDTPWSLSAVEDKTNAWGNQHDYFSSATVTVREKKTGNPLSVSNLYHDSQGLGIPNVLTWTVKDWKYDTWYTVTVEPIDFQHQPEGKLEYDVFIDRKNLLDIQYPLEAGDTADQKTLTGTLSDRQDKDSYRLFLQGKARIEGSSQFSNQAFFILVYDEDKRLVAASDQGFELTLPPDWYTVVVSDCHPDGTCYTDPKTYQVQIQ